MSERSLPPHPEIKDENLLLSPTPDTKARLVKLVGDKVSRESAAGGLPSRGKKVFRGDEANYTLALFHAGVREDGVIATVSEEVSSLEPTDVYLIKETSNPQDPYDVTKVIKLPPHMRQESVLESVDDRVQAGQESPDGLDEAAADAFRRSVTELRKPSEGDLLELITKLKSTEMVR